MALIKSVNYETSNILYCTLITDDGEVRVKRYYSCPYDLYRAYRQLLSFKSKLKPLYAVVDGMRMNNMNGILI